MLLLAALAGLAGLASLALSTVALAKVGGHSIVIQ